MSEKYRFTRANVDQTADKVYQFIVDYIQDNGYSPSVRDICKGIGVKSTSTIHNHLTRLQNEGRITYSDGKRRAIVIPDQDYHSDYSVRNIPLIGQVTAGAPILAVENIEKNIPVPDYFDKYPEMYVLRVRGDSMQDAAIMDGDLVYVEKKNYAQKGNIIVALIDDEATVKVLGEIDGRPYLIPKNSLYETIPFDHDGCRILGVVRGVLRVAL